MTALDLLRLVVVALALFTGGAIVAVLAFYLRQTWRRGRAPGAILARHVCEVSTGALFLIVGNGIAIYTQLGGPELIPRTGRLWLYLVGMLLLLSGVIEVGRLQRLRRAREPAGRHRPRP